MNRNFSLETLDFNGKKLKDMSSVSVITFKIESYEKSDFPIICLSDHFKLYFKYDKKKLSAATSLKRIGKR